jgi:acyl carrier protein
LQALGISRLTPDDGIRMLDRLAGTDVPVFGVMPVAWGRLFQADPNARLSPLMAELLARYDAESDRPTGAADGPLARAVLEVPASAQGGRLRHGLREVVAAVMRTDPGGIQDETPFTELGVDSLMAVEMKNRIWHETRIDLPLVQLLEGPSVASLAATILAAIKMAVLTSRAAPDVDGADLEEIEI